jgi:cytochrome c biogenesis protein CcmG/thiol:disulfide interchange protein DsbE
MSAAVTARSWRGLIPLALFLGLAALLALGLRRGDPQTLPSPLLDKPAPAFELPLLELNGASGSFSPQQLLGQVWVLNVFASWCQPCRVEHPQVMALASEPGLTLVGLNYKDREGAAWLHSQGNPYRYAVLDLDGRAGMDWGVYGVPETFVIDSKGRVRLKLVGPLTQERLQQELLPLIRRLRDAT